MQRLVRAPIKKGPAGPFFFSSNSEEQKNAFLKNPSIFPLKHGNRLHVRRVRKHIYHAGFGTAVTRLMH
jgi:uncharacterized protein (UPF0179 family)